ncbi:uncharacterized protein LOC131153749 [Malania oleifera]|uniref:uncharacterized protein LOC131153749 n=1 Tax=Malania oleifera TaxID=397392 RepID=UPI0025AE3CBD|nr:uncharacterized protein LOC131153749 [Malania oleifera]
MALAHKALRQEFCWPTMKKDVLEMVKWCDRCQRFVRVSVIYKFDISWAIVMDHERQFDNERFKKFCADLSIKLLFAYVARPQSNDQVENMDRTILHGLRTRLETSQSRWVEELPSIIWTYHSTQRAATEETPFMLTFGAKAVIPAEVGISSWQRQHFDEKNNNEEMRA